ncbi:hypothetical protein N7539_009245 [Penicillium diatomitis]|uniref:Uncharacterized protein n=1 Tax=Penicillium diatomitis TaxID=2819901 RepID=A0A9X0BJV9_9EURO|nr:uncharacterized protein N7539_009245 [Penicillium diatomitis]KAJ5469627.1 hypothetical protein N7539_009245 [Penicillium diatomitis]
MESNIREENFPSTSSKHPRPPSTLFSGINPKNHTIINKQISLPIFIPWIDLQFLSPSLTYPGFFPFNQAPTSHLLTPRAPNDCPSNLTGGAIAGIVIGSIFGTLLLIWLWRFLQFPWASDDVSDVGYRPPITRTSAGDERRRRRRRSATVDYYVEKPRSRSRGYREEVRRPAKVYLS